MRAAALLLLLGALACDHQAGAPGTDAPLERVRYSGGVLLVANECNSPADLDRIRAAGDLNDADLLEGGFERPRVEGLLVVLRPLSGFSGRYWSASDSIELQCRKEGVLRHELHHRQARFGHRGCDYGKIARTVFENPTEDWQVRYNQNHPLRLDCSRW